MQWSEGVGRRWRSAGWVLGLLGVAAGIACKTADEREEPEEVLVCTPSAPLPPPDATAECRAGWCLVTPQRMPVAFTSGWSTPEGTTWLVGANGSVVRARGTELVPLDSGTVAQLDDVWASSDTDVWAAGAAGTLVHWNGARWQPQAVPTTARLHALAGSSGSDVWVAGTGGLLLHRDGEQWVQVATGEAGEVSDLASAGPGELWASAGGHLLRCSASGCQRFASPPEAEGRSYVPTTLLGFPGGALVVLGRHTGDPSSPSSADGALLRWQDGTWTRLLGNPNIHRAQTTALAGTGPQDLWLAYRDDARSLNLGTWRALIHVTGSTVTPVMDELDSSLNGMPAIQALAAPASGDLYAAWSDTRVERYAQGQWSGLTGTTLVAATPELRTPRGLGTNELVTDLAVLADGQVAVATNSMLEQWGLRRLATDRSGTTWTVSASRTSSYLMRGIFVPGPELTLKVTRTDGSGTHETYADKRTFKGLPEASLGVGAVVAGVHATSERNVWVVSASDLLHWDGAQWRSVVQVGANEPPRFTGGVWSATASKVWVAGMDGVLYWDGAQLAPVGPRGYQVSALWGASSSNVWAVGTARSAQNEPVAVAYHWDGVSWSPMPLPAGALGAGNLVDVVGRCDTDVDVVAQRAVFHWDGAQWTTRALPPGVFADVAARVGGELWLAGAVQGLTDVVLRPAP